MKKMTNIVDLRNDLLSAYSNNRVGKIDNEALKVATNAVGKIMATAKLEIDHQRLIKTNVPIPFLLSKDVEDAYKLKGEKA